MPSSARASASATATSSAGWPPVIVCPASRWPERAGDQPAATSTATASTPDHPCGDHGRAGVRRLARQRGTALVDGAHHRGGAGGVAVAAASGSRRRRRRRPRARARGRSSERSRNRRSSSSSASPSGFIAVRARVIARRPRPLSWPTDRASSAPRASATRARSSSVGTASAARFHRRNATASPATPHTSGDDRQHPHQRVDAVGSRHQQHLCRRSAAR